MGKRYHQDQHFARSATESSGEASGMENQATRKFGRYEILGELGRGAMGIVYKARDPQIGRMVAVKTIMLRGADPEEEQEFRKRFLGEAQAAGRLQHPGIVAIYDVGEDSENHDPFLILEFVGGESLSRVMAREKKLPLQRALELAEEIALALDYAHAQGVVHRDIKPANILLTEEGRAKIADLGIAQLNLAHFTLPGRVLGTPAYMAPEQLSGEGCDGRSDIFSLGVILYGVVTGHSPFQGNSATTVCFKVVNRDPIPASALDMDLPPALDAVISKAMAKDPAKRYQRGAEFAEDVRRLSLHPPTISVWTKAKSGVAPPKASNMGASSKAEASLAQAQQAMRMVANQTPVKKVVVGAAALAVLVMLGIPIRFAIVARRNATRFRNAQASAASGSAAVTPSKGATSVPAASAKPRESIIAEMNVDTASPVGTPAAPARTLPKATPKLTAAKLAVAKTKTHPAASTAPAAANIPAATPAPVPMSTLELAVEHQFKEATLSVWMDNQLVLTRPLRGDSQKKLVVFGGFHGIDAESLKVPAGTHQLHFRAQSADQSVDLFKIRLFRSASASTTRRCAWPGDLRPQITNRC
jgi:serine/threonine-protein kinase